MTGQTMSKFRNNMRGGRCNEKQVRAIGELDVAGPPIFLFVKETGCHRVFGKRLQCKGGNKFSGILRHHDKNFVTLFHEHTGELRGFVSGD